MQGDHLGSIVILRQRGRSSVSSLMRVGESGVFILQLPFKIGLEEGRIIPTTIRLPPVPVEHTPAAIESPQVLVERGHHHAPQ